jgi:hypothetical protein
VKIPPATRPPEVITLAVRWYLRFGLSYRDVEELLAERGVKVDQDTSHHPTGAPTTNQNHGRPRRAGVETPLALHGDLQEHGRYPPDGDLRELLAVAAVAGERVV